MSAEATVAADQAQVANATLQLSYCTINAPLDGRTGDLLVNVGNLVKASDTNPLVIINQIIPIDVKFALSEKQFVLIQEHAQGKDILVKAKLDVNPNVIKEGKVSFIDNTIDTQTGMIQLKASFPNDDLYFWPGQFIHITIPLMELKQALLLSTRAIQAGQNGQYVFLIDKSNTVKIRQIETGPVVDNQTVVTKGLQVDDLVVSEGQLNLTEGTKVKY
jgi:multidrug efflux system membrane fusion protein